MRKLKNIMRILSLSVFISFLSNCAEGHKKDIEFSASDLRYFADYTEGDSLFFESNFQSNDTIILIAFKNEKFGERESLFINRKPLISRWLTIKHLSEENWYSKIQPATRKDQIYQNLLFVTKYPEEQRITFSINFKDFYSLNEKEIGEKHLDTLILNGQLLFNYHKIEHAYPDRVINSKNIIFVYWTEREGLVAYQNKAGEVWTKKE